MTRPAVVFLLLGSVSALAAEDARVTFLSRQLNGAKDPRVRAQTVLLLGQTGSESAVPALCSAMKDAEAVVRAAAASALGDLRSDKAITCLKGVSADPDSSVKTAVEKALRLGPLTNGGLYLQVEPIQDKVGDLPAELVALAEKLMREKLDDLGAAVAPTNEDKKSAASLIRVKKLKAFQLRMQLLPGSTDKGLKVEMLVMTYPEQSLKGTWNVKASGAKPESLLKAMVPRVLDDAAADLEWKN